MTVNFEELYEQGMETFNKRDYAAAESLFHRILTINPRFADIQNKLGIIYNQTSRMELAAKAFEAALDLNPGYTEASLNLAITYSDLGQYDKAREVFERAARFSNAGAGVIDPFIKGKLANEHLKVGAIYTDLRLLDEAIDEYEKAIRLAPNFADIITRLGIALREKGRLRRGHQPVQPGKGSERPLHPRSGAPRAHLLRTGVLRSCRGRVAGSAQDRPEQRRRQDLS